MRLVGKKILHERSKKTGSKKGESMGERGK